MNVEKVTPRIGATVRGVDLTAELDRGQVEEIRLALSENLVLFFVDQKVLTPDQQLRFAKRFGEIDVPLLRTKATTHPEVTTLDNDSPAGRGSDNWHADQTFVAAPPAGVILQAHMLPPVGGDTCFASMYAAYDALSASVREFLEPLTAVHSLRHLVSRTREKTAYTLRVDLESWQDISHPVIAVHPQTGKKLLNVNTNWTARIDGLSPAESDHWLGFLVNHVKSPEFQMRHRWRVGDVAFWDNRCVQHYAVADYNSRRVMQRVAIAGAPSVAVFDAPCAGFGAAERPSQA